jgi:hypothetical protein
LWLSAAEIFCERLELADLPEWAALDPVLSRRHDELWQRSLEISLHEQIAQMCDAVNADLRSAIVPDDHRARESDYLADIGVLPSQRQDLELAIQTSIARGCDRTLAELLASFGTHGNNSSALPRLGRAG